MISPGGRRSKEPSVVSPGKVESQHIIEEVAAAVMGADTPAEGGEQNKPEIKVEGKPNFRNAQRGNNQAAAIMS